MTPSLPRVWDRNLLRVERAPRVAAVARVVAAAEEALSPFALPHRKLVCDDEEVADRLGAGLGAAGWRSEVLVFLRWPIRASALSSSGSGRERSWEEVEELFASTREDAATDGDPETVRQLVAAGARSSAARFFAAGDPPSALCLLWEGNGFAEIDDVNTLSSARRRGLGTAVVAAALRGALAGGASEVFLRAHGHDWPQRWYERLGFLPVGRQHAWIAAAPR